MSDDESETQLQVVIRPTGGNDEKFAVSIGADATVLKLKQAVADKRSITAEEQRLIYKGKILKDHMKVAEYGVSDSEAWLVQH